MSEAAAMKKLCPHPRLFITRQARARLRVDTRDPFLTACRQTTLAAAELFVSCPPLGYTRNTHNEHLLRAREVLGRVVTLLSAWDMTGKNAFRAAALKHIRLMGEWECWSWITWRQGNFAPDAIFDLSYGENATTLAIAYDWLFDTLTEEERTLFLDIAKRWPFAAGLKHGKPGGAWWYGSPMSNWNTVCAGGLGMLAMAMYEEVPAARKLLPLMDASIEPFFGHLRHSDGAWPEGIGYWNYGMYYGFMYLLSHENATGKKHPVFRMPEFRKTLSFPIEFCPNGVGCSFGDVNHWSPLPLHFAVAKRIGAEDVAAAVSLIAAKNPPKPPKKAPVGWPAVAEWCLLHEGAPAHRPAAAPVAKLYKGQYWGVFSDDLLRPTRAMTVRGGTTKVPHGHLDLLSFHCVVGDRSMITNLAPAEYLDTTFSARRWDIFEMRPDAKNTLFINGVGITPDSSCDKTEFLKTKNATAIRMDASSAFGGMRDGKAACFCGRIVLFVRNTYWIIVDRMETEHVARLETRMHTLADIKPLASGCALTRDKSRLRVTYAANVPATFVTARGAPTTPSVTPATMLRWAAEKLHKDITFVTVLNPGTESRMVALTTAKDGKTITVTVSGRDGKDRFALTPKLTFRK